MECYLQSDFTKHVDSLVPVMEKYQVELPETIYRYYERETQTENKGKRIIEQVLLYEALINRADYLQQRKGTAISYSIKKEDKNIED